METRRLSGSSAGPGPPVPRFSLKGGKEVPGCERRHWPCFPLLWLQSSHGDSGWDLSTGSLALDPVASATPHYTQGQVLGYMGYMGLGGSGLGSSPWITTAVLSHSAFLPRSPQGVQQRGPVPPVNPFLPGLQGEHRHILLLPLLFLFQHFSGPGP